MDNSLKEKILLIVLMITSVIIGILLLLLGIKCWNMVMAMAILKILVKAAALLVFLIAIGCFVASIVMIYYFREYYLKEKNK